MYSASYMAYKTTKLDYSKLPLPYTGTYIDGQRMVWKYDKSMRCQDLPFLEKLAPAEPLWWI